MFCRIIDGCYLSTVGRLSSAREYKLCLHRNLSRNLRKEDLLHMITIETIYYIVVIASILCGAAYKIGYEHGKNARK